MADLRPLVARLADELDYYRQLLTDDRREIHALAAEARAALAEPQPPAAGEVAEVVALIRQISLAWEPDAMIAGQLTRAADLLERQHPQPIPVSERLPEAGDCDAEGRCWFNAYDHNWLLEDRTYGSNAARSHWLPAHALPLPIVTENTDDH